MLKHSTLETLHQVAIINGHSPDIFGECESCGKTLFTEFGPYPRILNLCGAPNYSSSYTTEPEAWEALTRYISEIEKEDVT